RTEVEALEENAPIRDAVELAIESGFSRIPVYHETIDDICGVIYAKDLLTLVFHESAQDRVVRDFMREVLFAPETQKCGELFKELTRNKVQLAVAVDEYGGTAGVVTLEDLLETIVGNIQDEYDDETDQVVQLEDGSFEMQGNADYEEAMELMGAEAEEDTQFETVAGMISEELGRVPEDGETPEVSWKGFRFKVLKVCDRRIERVRAEKIQVSQE
ncbi:MAG: HlyC/CorC family transporter, partial [Ruminococcus sp.]|nr:HlyC/CorC family transporter [Ruminococcus sp.]